MNNTPPTGDAGSTLLNQDALAKMLGLRNPRTLAQWRLQRRGPPYLKLGKRAVRYDPHAIAAWLARSEVEG